MDRSNQLRRAVKNDPASAGQVSNGPVNVFAGGGAGNEVAPLETGTDVHGSSVFAGGGAGNEQGVVLAGDNNATEKSVFAGGGAGTTNANAIAATALPQSNVFAGGGPGTDRRDV